MRREVDNVAFQLGLPERARTRVEDAGRMELADADASTLARSKTSHMILLLIALLGGLWAAALGYSTFQVLFLPFPAFWIGGVLEALNKGGTTEEKLRRVFQLLVSCSAGPICMMATIAHGAGE